MTFPSTHCVTHREDKSFCLSSDGCFWQRRGDSWIKRKLTPDDRGRLRILISGKNRLAHREVYAHFVGELQDGLVICHLDGNPKNNHKDNLLQASQAVNMSHKVAHGTHQVGDKCPASRTREATVSAIKAELRQATRSASGRLKRGGAMEIAEKHGVTLKTVHHLSCRNPPAWRHVQ